MQNIRNDFIKCKHIIPFYNDDFLKFNEYIWSIFKFKKNDVKEKWHIENILIKHILSFK